MNCYEMFATGTVNKTLFTAGKILTVDNFFTLVSKKIEIWNLFFFFLANLKTFKTLLSKGYIFFSWRNTKRNCS